MTNIYYSLNQLKKYVEKQNPSEIVLITSNKLRNKLDWAIRDICKSSSKKIKIILIHDGEKAKTWNEAEKVLSKLSHYNLDRKSIILALGGGSISDLVGFVASIYLRGISYINIPTTLLAQVDSAYGGKTGINFKNYKNQIGTFNCPESIIVDFRFLRTLKNNQIVDGLAEIIKYGFIKDKNILNSLKNKTLNMLMKNLVLIKSLIKKSIVIKNKYITQDFKDRNIRQMLNFGHTIGHSLELEYKISHGQAVIQGMIKELEIGEKLGITKKGLAEGLFKLLSNLGIKQNQKLQPKWSIILKDKKVVADKITLPIIRNVGIPLLHEIKLSKLKGLL